MNVLLFGATGMLGYKICQKLSLDNFLNVNCVIRSREDSAYFDQAKVNLHITPNVVDENNLARIFEKVRPNIVINCCGIINFRDVNLQSMHVDDIKNMMLVNSYLPHLLSNLTIKFKSRLILFSTDCVFSGKNDSGYSEESEVSPLDLYGRSKLLGEVYDNENVLTLRTSIIGHEIKNHHSLLEWFLNMTNKCFGYKNAFFSGLTTVEIAKVIHEIVIPNPSIFGLFHLSGHPISKYDLLLLISRIYKREVDVQPIETPKINRSLNGLKFSILTGYLAPSWPHQIEEMYLDNFKN